jgi:hypothetical protein
MRVILLLCLINLRNNLAFTICSLFVHGLFPVCSVHDLFTVCSPAAPLGTKREQLAIKKRCKKCKKGLEVGRETPYI